MTSGVPDSAGVPKGCTQDTMIAVYNDLSSVEKLMEESQDQVAAVIVEPVAANMGVVPPEDGFLQGLRDLCDKHKALLIFDEVITGFRLRFGGAAEYFGVTPDMVTYGKIIGAVTHVMVDDPTSGYGICIANMLQQAYCMTDRKVS